MEFDSVFFINVLFKLTEGLYYTLALTFFSLLLAFIPALFIANYKIKYGNNFIVHILDFIMGFIRSTPLILQLLLFFSFAPSLLNFIVIKLNLGINVFDEIEPFYYALFIFTLQAISLMSEQLRAALLAIDKGQYEAAVITLNSKYKAYIHIILPQALVIALPNLTNLTVSLIKGTALAFVIGVSDILAIAKIEAAFAYNFLEAYLASFIYYVILCSSIDLLATLLEKKLSVYKVLA